MHRDIDFQRSGHAKGESLRRRFLDNALLCEHDDVFIFNKFLDRNQRHDFLVGS